MKLPHLPWSSVACCSSAGFELLNFSLGGGACSCELMRSRARLQGHSRQDPSGSYSKEQNGCNPWMNQARLLQLYPSAPPHLSLPPAACPKVPHCQHQCPVQPQALCTCLLPLWILCHQNASPSTFPTSDACANAGASSGLYPSNSRRVMAASCRPPLSRRAAVTCADSG